MLQKNKKMFNLSNRIYSKIYLKGNNMIYNNHLERNNKLIQLDFSLCKIYHQLNNKNEKKI